MIILMNDVLNIMKEIEWCDVVPHQRSQQEREHGSESGESCPHLLLLAATNIVIQLSINMRCQYDIPP